MEQHYHKSSFRENVSNLVGENMKIVLYFILLSTLSTSSLMAAEWEPIGESGHYFDKSNLTVMNKNIVSAWIGFKMSNTEVLKLFDSLKKEGEVVDFSNYNYTLMQEYMNCKDHTSAIKYIIHYDKAKHKITTSDYKDIEYEKAIPKTIGDESLASVCKYANRNDSTEMQLFLSK